MPEAVDRLELVADEEEVLASRAGRRARTGAGSCPGTRPRAPSGSASSRARGSPGRRAGGRARSAGDPRSRAPTRRLRGGVRVGEAPQQLLEQLAVARRELVERRLLDRAPRLLVAGEAARAAHRAARGRRGRAAARRPADRSSSSSARAALSRAGSACRRVLDQARAASRSSSIRAARPAARRSRARAPGRPSAASRRRRSASAAARARRTWRAAAIRSGVAGAQNASSASSNASPASTRAWFSSRTRKRGSSPASNGCAFSSRWQKPWIVEIQAPSSSRARSWRPSSREPLADPAAQLAGRPLRVRDHEHRVDASPRSQTARTKRSTSTVVLPVPAPAETKTTPARLDRRALLGFGARVSSTTRHDRATRHIDQRSHHVGHGKPPFGSCRTSPDADALDEPAACSFARSIWRPERVLVEVVLACEAGNVVLGARRAGARAPAARRRARGRGRRAARCRRGRAGRACRAGSAAAAPTRSSPPSAPSSPTCSPGRSRAR